MLKYFGRRHTTDAELLPRITTPRRRIQQAAAHCRRCGAEREVHKLLRPGGMMAFVLHCPTCGIAKQIHSRQVF